jgi:hypothetical protein
MAVLANGPVDIKELISKLAGAKKENFWKVLEFLQGENIIASDAAGKLWLK